MGRRVCLGAGSRLLAGALLAGPCRALVRVAAELNSSEVGKLPTGTRVHVLETRELPDGTRRARIALDGQDTPYGWLTATTGSPRLTHRFI